MLRPNTRFRTYLPRDKHHYIELYAGRREHLEIVQLEG